MPRIETFDHCGFVVEDIPRAHKFYGELFGAKPMRIANLNLNAYKGWPIISFVDMGAHRFELCLAMTPLVPTAPDYTALRIGFVLPSASLEPLKKRLGELEIAYRELPNNDSATPIEHTIQLRDPDGNVLDLSTRRDHSDGAPASGNGATIPLTDISHIALEVTDLDVAERFYQQVLGLELLRRDAGDVGKGRLIMQNAAGQLLFLEKVDQLSPRSRFTGPDRSTAPDPNGYVGAHLAVTIGADEYDEMYASLQSWGVKSDGDIRKAERTAGEKSDYFYDPAGNRIQIVAFAPSAAAA